MAVGDDGTTDLGWIKTKFIQAGAVTANKLAADAVGSAAIAAGSIATAKLAANAVTIAKLGTSIPIWSVGQAIPMTANVAVLTRFLAPASNMRIASIKIFATTAASSSAGTYLLTAANTTQSKNLISTANYDLELMGNATLVTLTLTATAADLVLTANDILTITTTSNNNDLTGGAGLYVWVNAVPVVGS